MNLTTFVDSLAKVFLLFGLLQILIRLLVYDFIRLKNTNRHTFIHNFRESTLLVK